MKKTLSLITLFLALSQVIAQSPDKICFDYDAAGNRIAQKPAVIDQNTGNYNPDCTPSEGSYWGSGIGIIKISHIGQLEELIGRLTDIRWVLPIDNVPISTWSTSPVYTPLSDFVLLNPHSPYAIVFESALPPAAPPFTSAPPQVEPNVSIVPNPNEGQFKLEPTGFDPDRSEIFIINMQGVVLFKRDYVNGEINISESLLSEIN
ncbi:MAG: hypothetical protein ACK43K_11140 [Chitinophagales bacterium]|jgi:hypothetical protein|nr:SMP-30/gluconolactonase/LRE family protein [Sphingobacteriales bacterium]